MALSSPVKLSCSLTKWTSTPLAVSLCAIPRRPSRFRARRSMECTITVSPSRTKPTMVSSSGRRTSLPEALSVKMRSSATPSN